MGRFRMVKHKDRGGGGLLLRMQHEKITHCTAASRSDLPFGGGGGFRPYTYLPPGAPGGTAAALVRWSQDLGRRTVAVVWNRWAPQG